MTADAPDSSITAGRDEERGRVSGGRGLRRVDETAGDEGGDQAGEGAGRGDDAEDGAALGRGNDLGGGHVVQGDRDGDRAEGDPDQQQADDGAVGEGERGHGAGRDAHRASLGGAAGPTAGHPSRLEGVHERGNGQQQNEAEGGDGADGGRDRVGAQVELGPEVGGQPGVGQGERPGGSEGTGDAAQHGSGEQQPAVRQPLRGPLTVTPRGTCLVVGAVVARPPRHQGPEQTDDGEGGVRRSPSEVRDEPGEHGRGDERADRGAADLQRRGKSARLGREPLVQRVHGHRGRRPFRGAQQDAGPRSGSEPPPRPARAAGRPPTAEPSRRAWSCWRCGRRRIRRRVRRG
ncbi:hypothetical protein SGRIM128S_08299 [Streptomyces griseomycini]